MNRSVAVLLVVAVIALLSTVPGTVAAADDVGICVVGVESPCNGASGAGIDSEPPETSDNASVVDESPIQFHPDELPYASEMSGEATSEGGPTGHGLLDRIPGFRLLQGFLAGLF